MATYKIEKKGKQFILFNEETGKVIAAHKDKKEAIAQGRSIDIRDRKMQKVNADVEINIED